MQTFSLVLLGLQLLPVAGQADETFITSRKKENREQLVQKHGGTKESEAAVEEGLRWLARVQTPPGNWKLDGAFPDPSRTPNDIAATAFGLLPFLGAGYTHKPSANNPYDKVIARGLMFLVQKQDRKTGNLSGGMYAHSLGTITLCEAYGLTSDPALKQPAEKALGYLLTAQHQAGGWRYAPGQAGDTSVTGFVMQALYAGKQAGLAIPVASLRKMQQFFEQMNDRATEGYGYVDAKAPTQTMSAVGLAYRQKFENWGPTNPRLIRGIDNHLLKENADKANHLYLRYYVAQVMLQRGGEGWEKWNKDNLARLLGAQTRDNGPAHGSWPIKGDPMANMGGRLMITSLSLLTLEVYYRYPVPDRKP